MKISKEGLSFILNKEGCILHLYNDFAGHTTIGVGHLVHKGKIDGTESEEFKKGITKEEALNLLKNDCKRFEDAINKNVKNKLEQNQFDALVSFAFNIGVGAFCSSTLLKVINNNTGVIAKTTYVDIRESFLKWNKIRINGVLTTSSVLMNRRIREAKLYLDAKY